MELVSGWSDDKYVYLVEKVDSGGGVRVRRMRAKWSAFFVGLDEGDRLALQRLREVSGLSESGKYTRVDFVDKWARKDICFKLGQAIEGARAAGSRAEILEADVNPLRRFMSDHGSAYVSTNPRLAWLDLETDSRRSFAEAVNGNTRILCWSMAAFVDGEAQIVATGMLEADTDVAERALIEQLLEAALEYDTLLAWSGDGFDFPVLAKRADSLHVKLRGMRPLWNRWCWLDCLEVFRKYHAHVHESGEEKTSYKLNNIAQAIVGEGKKDFVVSRTWESWAAGGEERAELLRYNEQDTLLMPKIEARTGYVALHVAVCSVTRCFPDSRSLMASQQGDGFLLRLGELHGHRWPTKRILDEEAAQYSGAFVMEPTRTGIIDNVHVADFASLYPSIIRSWNISPETVRYLNDASPNEGCARLPHTDSVKLSLASRGMFPRALDELVEKRAEYSRRQDAAEPGSEEWERFKRLSGAYKIVANSFYGIMGSPFARFFSSTAAEAVTQTGAWLIKRVAAASKEQGLDAFYGDSVTGDRVIPVKNPIGAVQLLPISELWDLSQARGVTETGKDAGQLPGWRALAEDSNGVAGWFRINAVLRHETCKATWLLTTKHGQTEVTTDHGIMVNGEQIGPERFVRENCSFTQVAAPRELVRDRIDLLNYVGDFLQLTAYKGRMLERSFAVSSDGNSLVMNGWGDAESGARIRRFFDRGTPEWDSLIRLVCAYASDGSSSLRGDTACRNLLSFCKADLSWQQRLADDLSAITSGCKIFGPYWSDTVYIVRSETLALSAVFAELCGVGSSAKRFPSFMFELDDRTYRVAYDALARGDGSIDSSGQMAFTSTSQQLIAGVSYLLSQHGVEHGFSYRPSKAAWTLRTRPSGSERPGRYSIRSSTCEPYHRAVYDLEVEGAHTFVDAVGRVLLHNTDSCFVNGDSAKFSGVVRSLNQTWEPLLENLGCAECHIKLEFEKSFSRIVLVSAKRYVGRFSVYKGKPVTGRKIEVKGLEYKRGDTMRFTRAMQKELIDLLLGDELPTFEKVSSFVESWKERVLRGELHVDDIVLSQSVKALDEYSERYTTTSCGGGKGKTKCKHKFVSTEIVKGAPAKCPLCGTERKKTAPPVHVRVAKLLAERGEEIRSGTRVEYLIVSHENERLDAVPARDPGALSKIDRAFYWHTRIYPPTARLLESAYPAVAWTETAAEKKTRRKQTVIEHNLGDFGPLFGEQEVLITLDRELDTAVDMRELKQVLEQHRGERRVVLMFVGGSEEPTTLQLSRYSINLSQNTINQIERVCGTGTVSLRAATLNLVPHDHHAKAQSRVGSSSADRSGASSDS